jgi:SET domain-containing protein
VRERFARAQPAYGPGRRLKRGYESVYECHALCSCSDECANRVVQRGMSVRLEVFRTPLAGWAVRTVDAVPAGVFICEYAGEHLPDDEAEERGILYDQLELSRLMDVQGDGPDALRMCVDATNFSNVARFINHSCAPNCHKQRVFADHHTRLPRIALFALCDIAPLEEISYDYGYLDVPGKTLPCHCGARNCKQKLY